MAPVLLDGDSVFTNKLGFLFERPKRYDLIVFEYQYRKKQHYVKRVIGLPGETVQILEGNILIDGKVLEDDCVPGLIDSPRRAQVPVKLGQDEYFVLGDNRNESADSRDSDIANIKYDQIIGKAVMRISPLHRLGFIR